MRTYKEPKRIDKARVREPGLVSHDDSISKLSALSSQADNDDMENSHENDERVDDDIHSDVQENHVNDFDAISEDDLPLDAIKTAENDLETKENESIDKVDKVSSSSVIKRKTPPKKAKKVIESNLNHTSGTGDKKDCDSVTKNNTVESKKRKLAGKNKEAIDGHKNDVINNCVVDLGSKEKISPKSKKKPTKLKKKSEVSVELEELHIETSEKSSSFNSSETSSVSPRSSKRTPVKNRKYQSDEEFETSKDETDSSGKKKRSRSKSPRCSTPKRRKLDFDENEFMNIDDDFIIKKNCDTVEDDSNSTKGKPNKKVVKSTKNKIGAKKDLILKPKGKRKNKLLEGEKKESSESCEKSTTSKEESSETKDVVTKDNKKKGRQKKTNAKDENDISEKNGNVELQNDASGVKSDDDSDGEGNNDETSQNEMDEDNVSKRDQEENSEKNDKSVETEKGEKGEKKEKRKMKPLEEVVCSYCKKVSIGKAANTRHLKKCYVYQAKLEMQRLAGENAGNDTSENTEKSLLDAKDSEKTQIYSEATNESNTTSCKIESKDISMDTDMKVKLENNQNEDKENLDDSLTLGNDSISSENKSDLNQSSRQKSKSNAVYNCQHCDYSASKRSMLAKHLHCHSIYMCLRCSFFCESNDDLNDHMHREHKDRMDHKLCRKCSRYVHCADITLEQHMETCQGPVPFKCPHCEKEFKYESSLKSHVLKHDPDAEKKFSCPQCSYKSNYKANLKKHLVNIHSSRVKQFKCTHENCEKMFHSEDNLKRHLKWHKVEKPFKCDQCGKCFRTSSSLSGHCVIHSSLKPFKCHMNDCEKAFRSQKHLYNHLQDYHSLGEKKFVCQHPGCDFAFFKRSHLSRHMVTHSGERKYGCSYCGKAFRHADNVRVHVRQHTNEKPVSCNMCDFKCRQKSSLRYHLQKVHNIVFKKREKRKKEPNDGDEGGATTESKLTVSSLDVITAIVNSVAKSEDLVPQNDTTSESKPSIEETPVAETSAVKPSSPLNKAVDLYEFKSDDEFGNDDMPLPLPIQRPISKVTQNKPSTISAVDKKEVKSVKEKEVKDVKNKASENEDEPTDTEYADAEDLLPKPDTPRSLGKPDTPKSVGKPDTPRSTGKSDTPKKLGRRGKKKKINYAEPETDISFETVESKEENKDEDNADEADQSQPVKKKRGRKSKLKAVKAVKETLKETEEKEEQVAETKQKGRRGRKKIEKPPKIPKKRGRKPKNAVVEETKDTRSKSPPKKKKVGRPRKVKPATESEDEKSNEEKENETENEINEDDTIQREDEDDDTVDVPTISPPRADDDDDDTREYTGDENINENSQGVPEDEKEETDNEEKKEEPVVEEPVAVENQESGAEKQSENESDKMSSGIDTDFEDDLKPPPAPRPPPVVDSDEGDIESGPEDMDTPGRDFESTPPKSNLTEHIHSVPAHTPRDFESSPPKSVQTSDYGPSTHSQTGFEGRREGDSVEAMSGSYNATPSREVSIEEKRDDRDSGLPYSHPDSLQNAHPSPLMDSVQSTNAVAQSDVNPDYGSQSESTMPEVDKEYLGQYLQQFDSASRSEDDRIERMNSQNEQSSEPMNLSDSKELPPLNLSANAPPLNLSTSSNDRDNNQVSDMSNKRMEILSMDRQQDDHFAGRQEAVSRSSDRLPDNVYESINSMNTFMPSTSRESQPPTSDSPFPVVSTPSTFMRFSESDALLQRQRMTTPFLSQGDPNALQNLHRMADNALAQHNNASLLRRPTTVPPREDMFSSSTATMATIARNPFHNSWASQEVRPAHWGQSPYLGRSIDRPTAATSSSLFGKDNYLAGREFMFDPSRRAVADRNVFPGLPQTQRPELPHDTFSMDRFDIGSYFGGHTYPGASSLTDYNRAAAAHSSQKTLDERYRQSSTGISDFRALPQTTASSVFSSNVLNSSFHFDKYMYSRDPVYHAQHLPEAANSPFLPGVPGQHSMFDREYTRGYFQNSPYSLDKQYAAAAAASAKLSHPSGASVVQDRDLMPRPGTAAATGDNQVPDAYRHQMFYNMMNHRFYE